MIRQGIGHAVPFKTSHLGLLKAMSSDVKASNRLESGYYRAQRSREEMGGALHQTVLNNLSKKKLDDLSIFWLGHQTMKYECAKSKNKDVCCRLYVV